MDIWKAGATAVTTWSQRIGKKFIAKRLYVEMYSKTFQYGHSLVAKPPDSDGT